MPAREGFEEPDFTRPISLEAQKRLVQPGATVKGMQFQAVLNECTRRGFALEARTYRAFLDYPGEEFLDVLWQSATRCAPDVPPREALRRLGHVAYPALRDSLIGRVIFGAVGDDVGALLKLVKKGYDLSSSTGSAELLDLTDDDAVVRLEGMYSFVDCWHVGIFEGGIRAVHHEPTVWIRPRSHTSADFWVRWSPR